MYSVCTCCCLFVCCASDSFFSLTGQLNLPTRHTNARRRAQAKVKEASRGSACACSLCRVYRLFSCLAAEWPPAFAALMKGNPEVFLVIPLYRLAQKLLSEARPPSLQDCGAYGGGGGLQINLVASVPSRRRGKRGKKEGKKSLTGWLMAGGADYSAAGIRVLQTPAHIVLTSGLAL